MKNTNRFTSGGGEAGAAAGREQFCPGESTAAQIKKCTWTTAPIIDVGMRWEPSYTRVCLTFAKRSLLTQDSTD